MARSGGKLTFAIKSTMLHFTGGSSMNVCRLGLKVASTITAVTLGHTAQAQNSPCSFPRGDQTTAREMITNIRATKAVCGMPWRALKRVVADPSQRQSIEQAYDEVASRYPEKAKAARTRKADVAAAAGDPQEMLSIADANVVASPDDKSLSNAACFIRGRYGFDVEHAMPFCNVAVEAGRPGWALVDRGRVELALGQFKDASADFSEALNDKSFRGHFMMVDAAYGRGIARLKLGDGGGKDDLKAAMTVRSTVAADFEDAGIRP